jgi:hypothetical protein
MNAEGHEVPPQSQEGGAALAEEAEPPGPPMLAGMRVSAYVHRGRLCILAVNESRYGSIPIACHCHVGADPEAGAVPEGAIDFSAPVHPAVAKALEESERRLEMLAKKETFGLAVENLVRRARLGDQNAMGMIAMVRQKAEKGAPRAQKAQSEIMLYIQSHPHGDSMMGHEPRLTHASVLASSKLANGPLLTRARIEEIASTLGEDMEKALLFGCANYRAPGRLEAFSKRFPAKSGAFQTGASVGLARSIQMLRVPGSPIAKFSPDVAWELGE